MTITAKQRERRRDGITGSDAAAIVGASPFKTQLAVWLDKKGQWEPDEKETTMMRLGNALEPYIADEWTRRTGINLVETDTIVHRQFPYLLGHPDRLLADRPEGFEAKLVVWRQDDWGPPDTDLVPPYVHLQCDHYLAITGFERWHVAAQFGLRETRCYTIERDERIIERLLDYEHRFWRMIVEDERPPMMSPDDVTRMFPNDAGTAIVADATTTEALITLAHAKREAETWSDLAAIMEARVKGHMGENAVLVDDAGTPLATWKNARPSKRLDIDRFRVAHPKLYEKFLKPVEGSRRFLLKI